MLRTSALIAASAAAATIVAAGGLAGVSTTTKLQARLTVAQEIPKPTGTRTGESAAFTATLVRRSLRWKLAVTRLTGPVVGASIRLGRRGTTGRVAAVLCKPCRTPLTGVVLNLEPAAVRALLHGAAYVNVGTRRNPAGELRGQVFPAR